MHAFACTHLPARPDLRICVALREGDLRAGEHAAGRRFRPRM